MQKYPWDKTKYTSNSKVTCAFYQDLFCFRVAGAEFIQPIAAAEQFDV